MSEQQPERPAGAIPTEMDAPPATVDASSVEETLAQIDEVIGEGEPLPVGANDPDVVAAAPVDPPGMPHEADDLDREMAQYVQDYHDGRGSAAHRDADRVRPDQANIHDAAHEVIEESIKPRNVRQALLVHAQQMSRAQREAAMEYGRALVAVQEARDAYVLARDAVGGAEEALFAMDLATEEDHPVTEPAAEESPARVDDSMIR